MLSVLAEGRLEDARTTNDATGIDNEKELLDRVLNWTLQGDLRHRIMAMVLIGLVLYGATIILDDLTPDRLSGMP